MSLESNWRRCRRPLQNISVLLLVLIACKNLFAALPWRFTQRYVALYEQILNPQEASAHHVLSFWLGVVMLLLALRLYRRIRLAWSIEVGALLLTLGAQLLHTHSFTLPIVGVEAFVLAVLLLSGKDFNRRSDPLTLPRALVFVGISVGLTLLNATVGIFLLRWQLHSVHDLADALSSSVRMLLLMDTGALAIGGALGKIYADSLILINWLCLVASLSLLLKPLVLTPIVHHATQDRVRRLVLAYGKNPMSYLALERDKEYFFSSLAEGVCAYRLVGKVFVVCGDPICAPEDAFDFISELQSFCHQNEYEILLLNITDAFLPLYRAAGFGVVKYGEDACFALADYTLAGGRSAKVRAAVNHAVKAGLAVREYCPLQGRDTALEAQLNEISAQWLAAKGGHELGFMLGGAGLDDPMDRRYFYAADAQGQVWGFVVLLPYGGGTCYLADVTRRRTGAPQGVLELTLWECFQTLRGEGVQWANLGLSPLYNVAESEKLTLTTRLFQFIYENMNKSYNFKALHHAKEKYGPTCWQPRWLAYKPAVFSPTLAYGLVKVQVGDALPKLVAEELGRQVHVARSKEQPPKDGG